MEPVIQSFLAGFPVLLLHFAVTLAMLVAAVFVYFRITPHDEMQLLRAGNVAAAISTGGAIAGLALPLAVCMATSVSIWDIVLWGVITLVIQLVTYRIGDLLLKDLPGRIENDEIGPAIFMVSIKLAIAMINAAAVAG